MSLYALGGIVGTDNVSPIYEPNGLFHYWSWDEVYFGKEATGKHIVKPGDHVQRTTGKRVKRYIVTDVHDATGVPTLVEEDPWQVSGSFSKEDILFSVSRAPRSESYLLYLDKSVTPHRLSVCQRLYIGGSMTRYCKLFKGTDDSNSGTVISRVYDTAGNLLGENIPLERTALPLENGGVEAYCWTVAPAHTNFDLADGEIVTAVFYNDQGGVVERSQLRVYNTGYIRPVSADKKYISSIELRSPFISPAEPGLLQYPINVPLSGLNLMGVVNYSNGEQKVLPVDGRKFSVYGFDGYEATQAGQGFGFILKYSLDAGEASYNASGPTDTFIARAYRALTLGADGIYGLKLYCYPQWIDANQGYRLRWWLTNLARDIYYDVSDKVVINTAYRAFDPLAYGVIQRLSVSLNIRRINNFWKDYQHSQTVEVVLANQGTERTTNWRVGFTPNQSPMYGEDIQAYFSPTGVTNGWSIILSLGLNPSLEGSLAEWLSRLYYQTQPLFDPAIETRPPKPSHFVIMIGDLEFEFPIERWGAALNIVAPLKNNDTLFVRFVKRNGSTDTHLSVAGVPLWRQG